MSRSGHGTTARQRFAHITTTSVRVATEADRPALLEMGRRFIESSSYRDHLAVVPQQQSAVIDALLSQGGCWVLDPPPGGGSPVGMLGVVLAPLPLTGELAALEAMWWVEPHARGGMGARRMWLHAEDWARAHGAVWMQMLQPADQPLLADVYRRAGYVAVETAWMKRLQEG